ncbi:DSBA oxidoreductase [Sulfolobus islandicus Y.G.57.14]|jgi:predicted DsbA family dithiol-disulfide isomerase|uniref:DSBA oxidoreductase n=6 Tax=Saccharolobus islandicus TaxID=43080 RepID=C3MPE4_SACI2|nr:DsbA family protein [Sulfolobus islandicus]ACP35257.1 DSBA oxidoreductase [Sulfolobus islandicus L.S.2.15]ACP45412.1 DSBA oxidoreductase [Sulfolobus islandicus Y.G.57.14]ACP48787.1 DSBA oxidoreductase [Sulfolobus islandicus Y.N.15.51]ADB86937.1 DSBA oxidoreductase [Sulfolobus islandicus L.D.8.5]ADX85090.1 DSBA oxidoreductase [Sulfolobus islandicus REY15A]
MVVKITFFHDVLCPFCFVTSRRLRSVARKFNDEIVVKHKAFMIISSLDDLKAAAPTEEEARELFKQEFSIIKRYFPDYDPEKVIGKGKITWVWSLPPLMACKAAEYQRGDNGYWDYFDKAQERFFLEGENVNDDNVLIQIAEELGLDIEKFKEDFKSKKARMSVYEDEAEAHAMGIRGVPALLVNDYWLIRGVQDETYLESVIEDLLSNGGEPKKVKLKAYWEAT